MSALTRREFLSTGAVSLVASTLLRATERSSSPPPPTLVRSWPRILANDAELAHVRAALPGLPPQFTRFIAQADDRVAQEGDYSVHAFDAAGRLDAYPTFFAAWLALLNRLTGEARYEKAALRHVPAIRELATAQIDLHAGAKNGDLMVGHWLMAVALFHDWMHDRLTPEQLDGIRQALAQQARAAHQHFTASKRTWSYEQNHVFILSGGLGFAGFALQGLEPDADEWITCARDFMQKSGQALCSDGFYYEGVSYFGYAFHWHVLFAAALKRMTGEDWFNAQPFLHIGEFVMHHTTPGQDFCFDYGDWGPRRGQPGYDKPWHTVPTRWTLWALLGIRQFQGSSPGLDAALRRHLGRDYSLERIGMFHLLWACPEVLPASAAPQLASHHHFVDHGIAVWRENWDNPQATALWIKCGPPEGHKATELRRRWPDWKPNAGHAHPDAGHFMLWSRGRFLAGDTGYTCFKRTLDHNAPLIDGDGQFRDGRYHAFDAVDFATLDAIRFRQLQLEDGLVVADCALTAAYDSKHGLRDLERRIALKNGNHLLIRDRWARRSSGELTWLWHTDERPVPLDARRWLIRSGTASIVLIAISDFASSEIEPAMIPAYTGTPDVAPDWRQRGWRLKLRSSSSPNGEMIVAGLLNSETPNDADARMKDDTVVFCNGVAMAP